MTDAKAKTPTDAEIVALAYDCSALPETCTDATLLVFARAVLAKWGGSEAQAAAPIKTLEEAIAHAEDKAKGNSACAMEHAKLAAWLTELQLLRAARTAQRDVAIGMLADWVNAVNTNGTGWDDWDEHFKDAAFRPGPLRELLDEAIAAKQGGQ